LKVMISVAVWSMSGCDCSKALMSAAMTSSLSTSTQRRPVVSLKIF